MKIQMLVGMTCGFILVVAIGVASADDTPTSYPALPDVELVPAAVVAAGADSIDVNAVARLTTFGTLVQHGTAFQLDDGRIGTVAHALVDARRAVVDVEHPVPLQLRNGPDELASISRLHDVSAVEATILPSTLSVSPDAGQVGQQVALAGFPDDGRLTTTTGTIISRSSGIEYGIGRPDVYVISATIDRGWSGGPVVDGNGDVLAVIVGMESRSGVTLAVPIEYLPTP